MKKLLPPLLCYLFLTTQCFAAGPVFGSGRVSTIGFYSGVIRGITETDLAAAAAAGPALPGDTLPPAPGSTSNVMSSNAIGIFNLTVPTTGTATGAFLLFADGRVFTGAINGSADPSSATLSAILEGSFNFGVITFSTVAGVTTSTTTTVTASAVGGLTAKINGSSTSSTVTPARLGGTAFLDLNFGTLNSDLTPTISRALTFTVSGFKQTAASTAASTVSSFVGTGANGSGGASGSSGGTVTGGSGG